ncbi:DUF6622 family protein [Pseudoduganella sp. OTU4001]|uniref:DUF6622 family protein n=1 Tax=Pseudoduganella sp. OTU4001 TaxID=3043854 RepID=UPI00313DE9D9
MLQQIISHTPTYVWALLGLLVFRGVAASRDGEMRIRAVFIMPVVMLALGLHSVATGFGLASPAGAAWLAGLAVGAGMAWRVASVRVDRAAGTVWLRGSWVPMMLMLTIFVAKFAFAVALAMRPALRGSIAFALPACALFGALAGAFLGRPLRVAAALRAAPAGAARAAVV